MSIQPVTRRGFLASGSLVAGAAAVPLATSQATPEAPGRFRFGLNMSTIRGQKLNAAREIEVAAKAGYDAVEPWLGKLEEYVAGGGKLTHLRKIIEDGGLSVESAIGFAQWIVDDDAQRAKGFEQAKRDMDTIAQLGGTRIAASPAGAPKDRGIDPMRAAERYRRLLELGDEMGVTPQIEMWGGNKSIGRVSTAVFIAMEAAHPKACFLGDVYHAYKGGTDFASLLQLGPQALQTFHMNDYPADPPRETVRDEHRVYPGDGIAPLAEILRGFRKVGANPVLNLELFNRDYWRQPALKVAKTGLEKMKAAVAGAGF